MICDFITGETNGRKESNYYITLKY